MQHELLWRFNQVTCDLQTPLSNHESVRALCFRQHLSLPLKERGQADWNRHVWSHTCWCFISPNLQYWCSKKWPRAPTEHAHARPAHWLISAVMSDSCAHSLEGLTHPHPLIWCLSISPAVYLMGNTLQSNCLSTFTKLSGLRHRFLLLNTDKHDRPGLPREFFIQCVTRERVKINVEIFLHREAKGGGWKKSWTQVLLECFGWSSDVKY